jgi:type VI protein secretion system component VasK
MSFETMLRLLAAVLAFLVVGAAANYYFDLGWFGARSRLVLSALLFGGCIFFALIFRYEGKRQRKAR